MTSTLTPDATQILSAFAHHPGLRLERRDVQRLTQLSTTRATTAMRELRTHGLIQQAPRLRGTRPAHVLQGGHHD